eukprot:TRINITY_DN2571_c0_g1_i3.p1 TRINITY_DN2571_c0_g1~~TRINITY_DN2571_c0_g1_i3.p1  ORF type:complete len:2315 (+),score=509.23 TRINITY_DN2571_c0_g1_i3:93-7037(+)
MGCGSSSRRSSRIASAQLQVRETHEQPSREVASPPQPTQSNQPTQATPATSASKSNSSDHVILVDHNSAKSVPGTVTELPPTPQPKPVTVEQATSPSPANTADKRDENQDAKVSKGDDGAILQPAELPMDSFVRHTPSPLELPLSRPHSASLTRAFSPRAKSLGGTRDLDNDPTSPRAQELARLKKQWLDPDYVVPPESRSFYITPTLPQRIIDAGVVRIFLSSTFRDMQRERDRFFQYGAIELKKFAKALMIELVFIDLRWGLTAEDSGSGKVVIRCCESIEKCPYFVCFLGSRYGWVPNPDKTDEWDPTTTQRFPFLLDIMNRSVTEYEIQYAAMSLKPVANRAFFYFRDEQYAIQHAANDAEIVLFRAANETDGANQLVLKNTIANRFPTKTYMGEIEFVDMLVEDLKSALSRDFAVQDTLNIEDKAHSLFVRNRLVGFEGRDELLDKITLECFNSLPAKNSTPLVVDAQSGMGKSSIMAALWQRLTTDVQEEEKFHVFCHFTGCTSASNFVENILHRMYQFAFSRMGQDDVANDPELEKRAVNEGMFTLFATLAERSSDETYIFVIDAVNQTQPSQYFTQPHNLAWIPNVIPNNVALIISTIDTHSTSKEVQKSGWQRFQVQYLPPLGIESAITAYFSRFDKKLSTEQLTLVTKDSSAGHPLFLRILLDELRVFGSYENLSHKILQLLEAKTVPKLYEYVLTEWEIRFGKELVSTSMIVLFLSRIGLSESELDAYLSHRLKESFEYAKWKSFISTLLDSLFVRNRRYAYFHQLLTEAVQERYLKESFAAQAEYGKYGTWMISHYPTNEAIEPDVAAEVCHALLQGKLYPELVDYLRQPAVIVALLTSRYKYEFFSVWQSLGAEGYIDDDIYRELVKDLAGHGKLLVRYFVETGQAGFVQQALTERIKRCTTDAAKIDEYMLMGAAYILKKQYVGAIVYLKLGVELSKREGLEGTEDIATAYRDLSRLYYEIKKLDDSLEAAKKATDIWISLHGPAHPTTAAGYIVLAETFAKLKMEDQALQYTGKAFEIVRRANGDDHPQTADIYVAYARIHSTAANHALAAENYGKAFQIKFKIFADKHPSVRGIIFEAVDKLRLFISMEQQTQSSAYIDSFMKTIKETVSETGDHYIYTIMCCMEVYNKLKMYSQAMFYQKLHIQALKLIHADDLEKVIPTIDEYIAAHRKTAGYDCMAEMTKMAFDILETTRKPCVGVKENDEYVAWRYTHMADVLMGDRRGCDNAKVFLKRSLEIISQMTDPPADLEVTTKLRMTLALRKTHDWSATAHGAEVAELAKAKFGDSSLELAQIFVALGKDDRLGSQDVDHMEAAYKIMLKFPSELVEKAALLCREIGEYYMGQRKYEKSDIYMDRAVDFIVKAHGEQNPLIVPFLVKISKISLEIRSDKSFRKYFDRAADVYKSIGESALADYQALCKEMGDYVGKRTSRFEKLLEFYELGYGHDHPEIAKLHRQFVIDLTQQGYGQMAGPYLQVAEEIEAKLGIPPQIPVAENTAPGKQEKTSTDEEELQSILQLVESTKAVLGESHPDVAKLYQDMGDAYLQSKQHNLAYTFYKGYLDWLLAHQTDNLVEAAKICYAITEKFMNTKKFEIADMLATEFHRIATLAKLDVAKHLDYLNTISNTFFTAYKYTLGATYKALYLELYVEANGKNDQTVEVFKEAADIALRTEHPETGIKFTEMFIAMASDVYGENDKRTTDLMHGIGCLAYIALNGVYGMNIVEDCLVRIVKSVGEHHAHVGEYHMSMLDYYLQLGTDEDLTRHADLYLTNGYALGPDTPQHKSKVLDEMAEFFLSKKKTDLARKYWEKIINILVENGATPDEIEKERLRLGEKLLGKGLAYLAIPYFKAYVEYMKQQNPADDEALLNIIDEFASKISEKDKQQGGAFGNMAIDIVKSKYGDSHIKLADLYMKRALSSSSSSDVTKLLHDALQIYTKLLGENCEQVGDIYIRLGEMGAQSRSRDSMKPVEKAIEIFKKLNPKHPKLIKCLLAALTIRAEEMSNYYVAYADQAIETATSIYGESPELMNLYLDIANRVEKAFFHKRDAPRYTAEYFKLAEKIYGPTSEGLCKVYTDFALANCRLGLRVEEGRPLFDRAWDAYLKVKEHSAREKAAFLKTFYEKMTSASLAQLAVVYIQIAADILEEAYGVTDLELISLYKEAVSKFKKDYVNDFITKAYEKLMTAYNQLHGETNTDICDLLVDMAVFYSDRMNDYQKAPELLNRAIEIKEKLDTEDHKWFLDRYKSMQWMYERRSRADLLVPIFEKICFYSEKVHGVNHEDTRKAKSSLTTYRRKLEELSA